MVNLYEELKKYVVKNNLRKQFMNIELLHRLKENEVSKKDYHIELGSQQAIACLKEKIMTEEITKEEIEKTANLASGRVLDYGAGIGDLSLELAQRGLEVTYYEVNNECSKFADFLFDEFKVQDKVTYDLKEKYNTIFAINVIDHTDNPLEVLQMFHKKLTLDGILVIEVSYDDEFNPVHISTNSEIRKIENYLYSAFTEIDVEEKDYHQRVFKKRKSILKIPEDKNGFMLLPQENKLNFTSLKIKVSEDIELVKRRDKYYAKIVSPYKENIGIEKELFLLLLKLEEETLIEEVYKWVEDYFKVTNFRDEFNKIVVELWARKIIKGKVVSTN